MNFEGIGRFFGEEGIFTVLMTRLFDTCLLSILWLVTSLPIFTIGPATQALYCTVLKIREGREGYIIRDYLKAFRSGFLQSTALGMIMMGSGLFLLLDIYWAGLAEDPFFHLLIPVFILLLFVWGGILMYVFAIQAMFVGSVRETLLRAAWLAFAHKGRTFLMLATALALSGMIFLAPILLIVNTALIPMINAGILLQIFRPYLHREE
ncbi:MAG: YesL family protein [Lachnospiraceae bacterium]|nr:YesL family protein [Lachnospiraceae bacterium]